MSDPDRRYNPHTDRDWLDSLNYEIEKETRKAP